jgi:hypothetical protein
VRKKKLSAFEQRIMDRTRAAICLLNTRPNDEQMKLDAFMGIFHPEYKGPRLRHKSQEAP